MSNNYEKIVNGANTERRDARCRRDRMIRTAMHWGGWLLSGLILMAHLATVVH